MYNLFVYVGIRHVKAKPVRSLMLVLAIAFGIALFVAIQIINQSTLIAFKESVEAMAGKAALTVNMGESGFSETFLEKLQNEPGVRAAIPMVESRGSFLKDGVITDTLMIMGIDLLKEQSVRSYQQENGQTITDPLLFLNQPDSIVVTKTFAAAHGLAEESTFQLVTSQGVKNFTVRGLLSPTGPALAYGGAIAIMDIDGARMLFGKEGKVDRVDIMTKPGQDPDELATRLRTRLGPGFTIEGSAGQIDIMNKMVGSYQLLLSLFGSLALLAGLFLIANAVSISVSERRKEIGTLRALGAKKSSILTIFILEAFCLGVIGAVLGVWIGRLLASALLKTVIEALSEQYQTKIDVSHLEFHWKEIILAIALGSLTALVAAIWPSVRAMQVSPLEALRPKEGLEGQAARSFLRFSPVIGGGMLLFLTVSSVLQWSLYFPALEIVNQIFAVAGAAFVAPILVTTGLRLVQPWLARLGGVVEMMAARNLLRSPQRTNGNVMTLTVGLLYVVMIATMNTSFKTTILDWFKVILRADLIVSSGSLLNNQSQPLSESLIAEFNSVPGVGFGTEPGAYASRLVHLKYLGEQLSLTANDEPPAHEHYAIYDVKDRTAEAAGNDLFHSADPVVFVSQNFVLHFKKKTGDQIDIATPLGTVPMRIVGVITDWNSPVGAITMARKQFKKYWNDPLASSFSIYIQPGSDPNLVRQEIDRRMGRHYNLTILLASEMRSQTAQTIDRSFNLTKPIQAAALFIGLLGLLNSFLVSVIERTRELVMLRVIGMRKVQIRKMILWETLFLGVFGALSAAVLGCWISYLWIAFSLTNMLGWVVGYSFPGEAVITVVGAGIAVAILAGIYPSYYATWIEIREALNFD